MRMKIHFAKRFTKSKFKEVVALCSDRPIDLMRNRVSWTTNRIFVTCEKCLAKPDVLTEDWPGNASTELQRGHLGGRYNVPLMALYQRGQGYPSLRERDL